MKAKLATLLCILVALVACGQPEKEVSSEIATFGKDVEFLRRHVEVILLGEPGADNRVAIVPAWQGRVMTSTCEGIDGAGFGWINYGLIETGKTLPHINPFGGEDRFWLGPEGGQFAIFFKAGDPFDLDHWQTPAFLDTEPFATVSVNQSSVLFSRKERLSNYSGRVFDVEIERQIRLVSSQETEKTLGVSLPETTAFVGFESENRIRNAGTEAWSKSTGLLSIWILGMYNPSEATTVVIPVKEGPREELGPIVNDSYFGKVPPDRLRVGDGTIYFKGDGKYRSKIGVSPLRAKSILGSWDGSKNVLTIVSYNQPENTIDYVNSMWELQDKPFAGDVVNSYNDGPPEPGIKPMGPFYELETSSPALELEPGESVIHIHRTFHFKGPRPVLDRMAQDLLGTTLADIEAPQ